MEQESIPPSQIPYPPEYTYPLDTLDTYPKLYPTPWKGPGTSYTLLPGRDMGPEIRYTQRTWNQGRGRTWHQRYPTPLPVDKVTDTCEKIISCNFIGGQ